MNRPIPDEVVIGLLKDKPMHGYHLLEKFRSKDQLGRIWTMSTSQMYAVLKRLEEMGAIAGEEIPVADAPTKVVYSVTPIGNKILTDWLFDENPPSSIHLIRVIFISRLYIAELLGFDTLQIIDCQRGICERQLKIFQNEREKAVTKIERLTVDFVISQLGAAIRWMDVCLSNKSVKELNY